VLALELSEEAPSAIEGELAQTRELLRENPAS
jgi:hypothetical protein